jgi:uncharacterized protein YlxW (UPF0749 family)
MGSMPGGCRPQNLDFQQKAHALQASIKTLEAQEAGVMAQAAMEAQFNQRSNELKAEIARRREYLRKMNSW